MDSISQFALGAAIGEATLGARLGRKAMLIGGLLGTLPDLDVLVHYADAVESYTYHRSWSHSLFVLALVSPVIAGLLYRSMPVRWAVNPEQSGNVAVSAKYSRWLLFVFLTLVTHPLLDGFTVYGTQLLWPFPHDPIAWGSTFIIDPLYTVPLLVGLWLALRHRAKARPAVLVALLVSTGYLALTLVSQQHARALAIASLNQQNLNSTKVLVAPAPFSLLWRIVVMDGDSYYEGFYSLLDKDDSIRFAKYASQRHIIDEHLSHWPIARLDWFTDGFIAASVEEDELIINDLRMGLEANYVFRFLVGRWNNSTFTATQSELLPLQVDKTRAYNVVRRMWDEQSPVVP